MATEAELQKKRDRAEKLRADLAAAESLRATREQDKSTDIEAAQLDAEIARLEVEVARAKEAATVKSVNEGAAPLIADAKEAMRAAAQADDAVKEG